MDEVRVIIGIEPLCYRDVVTQTLRAVCPEVSYTEVEPNGVDAAVLALSPDLVLISRPSRVVADLVPQWVLMYPGGASHVIAYEGGVETLHGNVDLDQIVSIVEHLHGERAGNRLEA